jgi:hypothetical protein
MAQERRDVVITGDAEAWAQTHYVQSRRCCRHLEQAKGGALLCGGDICNVRVKQ